MNNKAQFTINFQPVGKRVVAETSQTLLFQRKWAAFPSPQFVVVQGFAIAVEYA